MTSETRRIVGIVHTMIEKIDTSHECSSDDEDRRSPRKHTRITKLVAGSISKYDPIANQGHNCHPIMIAYITRLENEPRDQRFRLEAFKKRLKGEQNSRRATQRRLRQVLLDFKFVRNECRKQGAELKSIMSYAENPNDKGPRTLVQCAAHAVCSYIFLPPVFKRSPFGEL